ncbi:hypothetical protein CRYUN_Cryun12cG0173600 [Craigia yunnanensis]
MERTLWGHLPLLVRANSKESVEYILQSLWKTRKTGLDVDDRRLICEMLQLQNDSDLDPLLVCLRMLIRKCVYENINKDDIQKIFPDEVLPELQRLLTLLLQKFQREWRADIHIDEVRNSIFWSITRTFISIELDVIRNVILLKLIVFRFLFHA